MASEGGSPNDPAFFNHHTMVDCLLDEWLKKNPTQPYVGPVGNRMFAGHGPDDCLVPFFPLYTHRQIYKVGSELGFSCDLRDFAPPIEKVLQCSKDDTCDFPAIHNTPAVHQHSCY